MKLKYPTETNDLITSSEEFLCRRADASQKQNWQTFTSSLPKILISVCPFCKTELWMEAGLIFSLTDNFWFRAYSDGRGDIVDNQSLCKHLFCVDGSLNLNGHLPHEASKWQISSLGENWDYIWMASEQPFVKPRVMNLPGMVVVIHDFAIDDKYTAYPIVYFSEEPLYPQYREEFCIPWATKTYMDNHGSGYFLVGEREDEQDYNLEEWVRQEKLHWLDTQTEAHQLVKASLEAFPYRNRTGRQHPYKIVEGKVFDLPARNQSLQASFRYSD